MLVLVLALSEAVKTTIALIAIWFVGVPALVTALIVLAVVQARGEKATYEEQQRLEHESSRAHASPRPSFARRFRRFVFRGQLGPVGSHTPA